MHNKHVQNTSSTKNKPLFNLKDKFVLEISAIQETKDGYIYQIRGSRGLWIKESDMQRFKKQDDKEQSKSKGSETI